MTHTIPDDAPVDVSIGPLVVAIEFRSTSFAVGFPKHYLYSVCIPFDAHDPTLCYRRVEDFVMPRIQEDFRHMQILLPNCSLVTNSSEYSYRITFQNSTIIEYNVVPLYALEECYIIKPDERFIKVPL